MKSGFLDKLIERLGPEDVQNYLLRLAQEKGLIKTVLNSIQEGIIVTVTFPFYSVRQKHWQTVDKYEPRTPRGRAAAP